MCIICISPKGAQQPTTQQIKTMFSRNPHGAGYMHCRGGKVTIHKGFMTLGDLLRQLEREQFTADDVVVYHFRISTQAGVTPEMTQPFPVSDTLNALEALDVTCSLGVAHNGIIRMTSNGSTRYSDTAQFVYGYLPKIVRSAADLDDPAVLAILAELTCSKLALLDRSGKVATVGSFIHESGGLIFSNATYKPQKFTYEPVKPFTANADLWYDFS